MRVFRFRQPRIFQWVVRWEFKNGGQAMQIYEGLWLPSKFRYAYGEPFFIERTRIKRGKK